MADLRLPTTDAFLNIAVEEYLLDRAGELGPTLLLWRNRPCVVIGRHQNPWVECDLRAMRADALPLVRRISGGGAVYHDEGNTNFSFIAPAGVYDQERHFRVVIAALASLGIDAWKTERNDLRVGERKVSGNAFRHSKGNSLHHGTLLVHADLERLIAYLASSGALIETKATASVRSRVVNLSETRPGLTHDELCTALEEAFRDEYRDAKPPAGEQGRSRLDLQRLAGLPAVRERAAELGSWGWVYGHTPAFVRRLALPGAAGGAGAGRTAAEASPGEIAIAVRKGLIASIGVPADSPPDPRVDAAREALVGLRYERETIRAAAPEGRTGELVRYIAEEVD